MAVLASIGTAGVPGVDRLLDMMRTAVNVSGDAVITTIVARSENSLDLNIYNDANAGLVEAVELAHKDGRPV